MFFNVPVIAFDVIYNRETTHNRASYFKNVDELEMLVIDKKGVMEDYTKL